MNLVAKEKMHTNKNDFIKKIQKIEYSDDSDIKELFEICKKMLTGYYLGQVNYNDHKGIIHAYNNISLTKTNNMIIDEAKVNKAIEHQGKKYYTILSDKSNENDKNTNKSLKDIDNKSKKNKKLLLSKIIKQNKVAFSNIRSHIEISEYYTILEQIKGKKSL